MEYLGGDVSIQDVWRLKETTLFSWEKDELDAE